MKAQLPALLLDYRTKPKKNTKKKQANQPTNQPVSLPPFSLFWLWVLVLFRQVVLAISFCQEVRTPQTSALLPCSGFSHWHLPPSKKPQTSSVLWTSGYQERGWHPQTHFMLTTKWPQMSRSPYSQLACATQPGSARLSQKAATLFPNHSITFSPAAVCQTQC